MDEVSRMDNLKTRLRKEFPEPRNLELIGGWEGQEILLYRGDSPAQLRISFNGHRIIQRYSNGVDI